MSDGRVIRRTGRVIRRTGRVLKKRWTGKGREEGRRLEHQGTPSAASVYLAEGALLEQVTKFCPPEVCVVLSLYLSISLDHLKDQPRPLGPYMVWGFLNFDLVLICILI